MIDLLALVLFTTVYFVQCVLAEESDEAGPRELPMGWRGRGGELGE